MKILVIGNGFDLQHKLQTSYSDFLNYCDCYEDFLYMQDNGMFYDDMDIEYDFTGFMQDDLEHYEEFGALIKSFWIEYFREKRSKLGGNWIDFEAEIEQVVNEIYRSGDESSTRRNYTTFDLPEEYKKYATAQGGNEHNCFRYLRDELKKLVRLLEIYLACYVNKQITKVESGMDFIKNLKPDRVLSFNYTVTFPVLYGALNVSYESIHGYAIKSRKNDDYNLVLGYDDHYLGEGVVSDLLPFEKYYQRIVYRTGAAYTSWLEEKDELGHDLKKEVFFYGHSMSPADGDVIRRIICSENTKTTIFYRKEHEEDRANMIGNLAIILTPEELIKLTGGQNPTLTFEPV